MTPYDACIEAEREIRGMSKKQVIVSLLLDLLFLLVMCVILAILKSL